MPSHDPERAYVQSMLELADARLDQVRAEMAATLDLYRDDLSRGYAEQNQAHLARLAAIAAETDEYIKSLTGEADEPAPTQDVGHGQVVLGAPATGWSSPAGPGGPGPGQPPNPHAVELEEAERIRDMPMSEWAAERERLLIRPNQGMF